MFTHFFLTNLHFAIFVFCALTYFACGWLYIDSWRADKTKKLLILRGCGFILLACVSALTATQITTPAVMLLMQICKIVGLIAIVITLFKEELTSLPNAKSILLISPVTISIALLPTSCILFFSVACVYFFRATKGLEKQLLGIAYAFFGLAVAEALYLPQVFITTQAPFWTMLISPYGPLWIAQHIFFLGAALVLAKWVWSYLVFRPEPQLFIVFLSVTLTVFVSTTVMFTYLLIKNLEQDALEHLRTDANVFYYSLDRLQTEALTYANAISKDQRVLDILIDNDDVDPKVLLNDYSKNYRTEHIFITNKDGEIMATTSDVDKVGKNISNNPLFASAVGGQPLSTLLTSTYNALIPEIEISGAYPIYKPQTTDVMGVVYATFSIDNAFVDGLKDATGLDVTVFSQKTRSATTFTSVDGTSRFVGTTLENNHIAETVLQSGQVYQGTNTLFGRSYLTVYAPIKSLNDTVIGMIGMIKPTSTLFATAQKSLQLTFLGSVVLMVITIPFIYAVSKFIREHAQA